jgi:hypothetical protein
MFKNTINKGTKYWTLFCRTHKSLAHGGHWPFVGLNEIGLGWGKSEGIVHAGQGKIPHIVIPNYAQPWRTDQ